MSRYRHPRRDERDAAIRGHWATMRTAELGAMLGMDPSEVRKAARRMGLPSKAKGPAPRSLHGTRYRYQHGCRCRECRDAQNDYLARYRARRGRGPVRTRAVATLVNQNGREAKRPTPSAPARWRCGCDPYRLNAGDVTTCPACGTVPTWATTPDQRRTG